MYVTLYVYVLYCVYVFMHAFIKKYNVYVQ